MALQQTNDVKLEIARGIYLKSGFYAWVNLNNISFRQMVPGPNAVPISRHGEIETVLEFYESKEEKFSEDPSVRKPPYYSKNYRINLNDTDFIWSVSEINGLDTYDLIIRDICKYFVRIFEKEDVLCDIVDL
mgnify:CR=1 FL=1